MKKVLCLIGLLLTSLVAGCSEEIPSAQEQFEQYLTDWEKMRFAEMYEQLTEESKQQITEEQFIERYQNIYGGIVARDLKITAAFRQGEAETASEEDVVRIQYLVKMNTFVGPLTFTDRAMVKKEKRDGREGWYVDWKPTMILPGLEGDDKVRVETLEPTRGSILDRNGRPLATYQQAIKVGVKPQDYQQNSPEEQEAIARLAGVTTEQIKKAINEPWVKPEHFVEIATLPKDDQRLHLLQERKGVILRTEQVRSYPYGEAAAHLIGYIGPINAEELEILRPKGYQPSDVVGKRGLEQIMEEELRGSPGGRIHIIDSLGRFKKVLREQLPVNGKTITLTIDAELQQNIFEQVKHDAGTAAAIDPRTGDVLALVSSPSYDPNAFIRGVSPEQWKEWQEDPNRPLLNRFSQAYAPGSTFKAITAAIGLNAKEITPDQKRKITGLTWRKDRSWGNYYVTRVTDPHQPVTLKTALIYSDNIYFAQSALDIGSETFVQEARRFGLGEKLPFVYPLETSQNANDGINSEIQLADSGYGQGEVTMTPLHLALAYSAFANEGSIVKPRLLADEENSSRYWKQDVIPSDVAERVKNYLIEVMEHPRGTGRAAKPPGIRLAGKTGTAELKQRKGEAGQENGWYVVFNTDSPRLLVAMMIEDVRGRGGSHYLDKKIKQIFTQSLQ
ncbi:penicillin-binding transpeptidase domain-containing protein [Brevibacillus humidisoli]|uniref:penicillin-binding transpeptidase domain-containing protein n=1 Tax=Brevibacillus humidisoli TaxID=2895522 RepID=UPI001E2860A4|nr:penicillin-binding transpeptidase domain-containing protein [Brevibacillus humidisoli]UFJ41698.1 penicillin-binding transpeptidase domain-containing protein [Brevibacillus humidisoli]